MSARIQTQYDFTANTGNAEAAVRRYAEQIKAANAVLAQAEKTAKQTYQSQSLTAKAAGASTEQLTKIQQGYFQSLVAIRNAAKETGTQLVSSNQNAVVAEDAKAEAIKLATAAIEQQTIAVKANAIAQSSAHTVSGQSAASGAVQLLDGRGGIRTIESFLGNTLGLGGVFTALFPVVGAIQASKLLFDLGEKVYDVGHKATEAGKLLGEAFTESHAKAQVTIDDLTVQADKIQDNIDKLSGHPSNGLKTALDEARVYADKLQQSLQADRKELDALLKEHQVGTFGSILSGVATTGEQQKQILDDHKDVEGKIAAANSTFNADAANAKSLDDIKKAGQRRDQAIRAAIQGTIDTYMNEAKRLRDEQTQAAQETATNLANGSEASTAVNNSAKIGNIQLAQGRYQDYLNTFNAQGNVAALIERENKLKGDKEAGTLASEASRKALEAQRKAAEDQRKQWDDDHAAWQSAGTRSATDELWFWINRANAVGTGSANYAEASKKADEALRKVNDDRRKQLDEAHKMSAEFNAAGQKALFGVITTWGKGQSDAITSQNALEEAQNQAKYTVAESALQYDVATGKLSRYDAAIQLQTLHTLRYNAALTDLQNKLAQVQGGPEGDAQRNGIQKQIVELNARRTNEQVQDSGAVAGNTVSGALKQANQQWLQNTQDLAPQVTAIYTDIFKGMNSQLADMLTGQKSSWGSFFRSLATQFATLGLNLAEAPLANAVQKSASNSSGIGSFFGSLFGGGKAVGGPVNAGTTYLVGENGPELFNPGSSGSITPNNQLRNMAGTNHWNVSVDARGASNPAEVEAAAHRAVMTAAPHIVAASLKAQQDQQSRRPYSQK